MSRLEELIIELCPDGVQNYALKDCCKVLKGKQRNKNELLEEGNYPAYNGGVTYSGFTNEFNVKEDTTIISQGGASAGFVQFITCKFWANAHCYYLEPNLKIVNNKYLFYYVKNQQSILMDFKHGAGIPALKSEKIESISIPIPPIEVQNEIVRILDSYTELNTKLITELTLELESRRKQYEHYRDELFGKNYDEMLNRCLKNNIKVITLEELGKFTRGKRFVRNDIKEEGIPCIHYGDLYTYFGVSTKKTKCFLDKELSEKMRFAHKGDVVIVQAGENDMDIGIGVAWMGDEDVVVHDACYIFEHNINPKYISYYLRTNIYHLQIKKYVSIGKICSISAQGIGKALIPIPSLEEQQRIVDILDKYDVLYKDITRQIQSEIETRQKQYEYYRDKLLTFKIKE